jgi:hypothetical protein
MKIAPAPMSLLLKVTWLSPVLPYPRAEKTGAASDRAGKGLSELSAQSA